MEDIFDFTQFPVLETERLLLRQITSDDAQAVLNIRGDYEVTKYNIGAAYTSIEQAQALIRNMDEAYLAKTELRWGIVVKSFDTMAGMIGYNYWDQRDRRGSVGFDLAQAFWRQGIMSEALQAVLKFGFERMKLNRIEADTSIYNHNSQWVLQKAGFKQEGHQREQYFEDGRFHDLLLFALLAEEY
ncbi:MAG TPA: GNAT family N-acetyltransferase, partial [Phototrophicaceae bacterium]|nr:GNAT family N-acetyltransferase [Phototrophicaceae bacterium]